MANHPDIDYWLIENRLAARRQEAWTERLAREAVGSGKRPPRRSGWARLLDLLRRREPATAFGASRASAPRR